MPDNPLEPVSLEDGLKAKAWLREHGGIKDFDAFERDVDQDFRETSSFIYPLFRWHRT